MAEYRDATYEHYDLMGYVNFYQCLILGIIGPYVHILVWNKVASDYVEFIVEPQTLTFADPTHKTELLAHMDPYMYLRDIFEQAFE